MPCHFECRELMKTLVSCLAKQKKGLVGISRVIGLHIYVHRLSSRSLLHELLFADEEMT